LAAGAEWPGLKSVVMVESEREIPATAKDPAKIEREARFYIASLAWLAGQIAPAIRSHWMIENGLHWIMDMMFCDDECRVRTDNAPVNFTTIKHVALSLIRRNHPARKIPCASAARLPVGTTTTWQVSLGVDFFTGFPWRRAAGLPLTAVAAQAFGPPSDQCGPASSRSALS
jgi:predicted transposase YbfD/YdcC